MDFWEILGSTNMKRQLLTLKTTIMMLSGPLAYVAYRACTEAIKWANNQFNKRE